MPLFDLPHPMKSCAPLLTWLAGLVLACGVFAAPAAAVETKAAYAIMIDGATGQVLFEKNADELMAPSSMSKLMTAEMVFHAMKTGRLSMDDTFHVSERAWKMEGSKMWTLVNSDIRVGDLLRGMIVQSGNDACVVLAEGLAGSEEAFAEQMTKRARDIGMTKSIFANSTGWPDPGHLMTARDLATLARHIILTYPDLYKLYSEKEFTWSKITQPNRNRLLWEDGGVDGLKTGHTEDAGYGLTSSAERNGRRVILVVNGLASERERIDESRRLIDMAFREYDTFDLVAANQKVATGSVFGGNAASVDLIVKDPVTVVMSRYDRANLKMTAVYQGPIKAPVKTGQEVGTLTITAPGRAPQALPIYAAGDVGRFGPLGALGLAVKSIAYGAFGADPFATSPAPSDGAAAPAS